MLRNYLAAALRNMARNRLYAAISIVGLAVGMAAAILTGLYIRDELTFDQFIPGHERIFRVVTRFSSAGRAEQVTPSAPYEVAAWLKLDFPGVQATARLAPQRGVSVRNGDMETLEEVAWVDPDFFSILPLPVVAGDLGAAMQRPDAVVLTRGMARKFFGQDAPVGETLEFDRSKPFKVAAVVEDLPGATNLTARIFVSGRASISPLSEVDGRAYQRGNLSINGSTYVRLPDPAAAAAINRAMPALVDRHMRPEPGLWPAGASVTFVLVPIGQVHTYPLTGGAPHASLPLLATFAAIAGLILLIAGINFVNLMTARGARRAMEVGVRKAAGAERRDLMLQFLGESVIYALLGLLLALALVELLLPAMNTLLVREIRFDYWRDIGLIGSTVGLALVVGALAGFYPALVLSGFRPAQVLKGGSPQTQGSEAVRAGLAVVQFAILVVLLLATVVIYRQTNFLLKDAVRVDHDQALTMVATCREAYVNRVKALPGVRAAACASENALNMGSNSTSVVLPDGYRALLSQVAVDPDFFAVFGVRALAGRLLSRDRGGDALPLLAVSPFPPRPPRIAVLNQSAVRSLRLGSPEQAIGRSIRIIDAQTRPAGIVTAEVVGVIPDFAFDLSAGPPAASAYYIDPNQFNTIDIKLRGRDIPETLAAIDRLWKQLGDPHPIRRRFVDQYLQAVNAATIRQGLLVGVLAAVAVFIAALGLFGLAAFTAERRTKEIGVRKAMGASTGDILRLLLWQFSKPVLWANLIAWPLGWWAMDRWLKGFASRVELQPWLFVAASAVALVIAIVTVFVHTLKVARQKPVLALRYE